MACRRIGMALAVALLPAGWNLSAATAEDAHLAAGDSWLAAVAGQVPAGDAAPRASKPIPLTVSVNYTLVTDYVFRGINFSEYRGEGREKLNHQLGVAAAYDTGKLGKFGAMAWFEWYADQERLTPGCGDHLQEVDYILYWSYPIEPLATTVETGWIGYTFPQVAGHERCTNEWYVMLSLDDGRLFGTKNNVLNPYVAYYLDLDLFHAGSWLEFGVSHDFALSEMGCKDVPVLKDLTITPSFVLGYDHRYLNKAAGFGREASRLGNLQYGLTFTYDLRRALKLPEWVGALSLAAFLKFSDAVRDDVINDEFWGGMTLAWEW
jgi:hypothetical protein